MGRCRKRFNEKARRSQSNEVHRDEKEKVEIDIQIKEEKYDSSNPLVICGKKENKTKGHVKEIPVVRPLSRKERKRLANKLAKKKKKLNRKELLEKLSKVQAKPEDLNFLTSTASMQTHGVKKLIQVNSVKQSNRPKKISNIKGSRKKKNLSPEKEVKLPPNVFNYEVSSSDSDDDASEEEVAKEEANFDTKNAQETNLVNCSSIVEESGFKIVSSSMNEIKGETNIVELEHDSEKNKSENNSSVQVPEILQPVNQEFETQKDTVNIMEFESNVHAEGEKKKNRVKASHEEASVSKLLSKKKKKKLESILAKKSKKINREELLEKINACNDEADMKILNSPMSVTSVQTYGTKRLFEDSNDTSSSTKRKKKKLAHHFKNESQLDDGNSPDTNDEDKDIEIENDCNTDNCNKEEICVGNSVMDNQETEENSPSNITDGDKNKNVVQEISSVEKCGEENTKQIITDKPERLPAVFVPLNRLPEIQAEREALPIFCEEQSVMEAINENPVVVIHAETGSGKTTQVPQFLYEAGYALSKKIIITEPRRIAAMSMAARVGKEMNLPDLVAYHVRYEHNVKPETKITFMTDGMLLKYIKKDYYLTEYSVVIVDEAHERSLHSDILIGLLSRIVRFREKKGDPLKLIIMSATIQVEQFTENSRLFIEPPFVIRLDSRRFKVEVHFNKYTPTDYIQAAYQKVCKIHTQCPAGAILVFLTGEREIMQLCKMLRSKYPFKEDSVYTSERIDIKDSKVESLNCSRKKKKKQAKKDASFYSLPEIDLNDYTAEPFDNESLQEEMSDAEEDIHAYKSNFSDEEFSDFMQEPLYTLPLYTFLPFQEQQKIFQPPPPGSRLCVVSTNIAETSITIPGLKYVVDAGKVKTKIYNKYSGGISEFSIEWTSKASASQRAGRAGRTEGGHCYRLYSSSVFEHEFPDFSQPEIHRTPIDDVLLELKALGLPRVINFPFPSPPDPEALKSAERRLIILGALENPNKDNPDRDMKEWGYFNKITKLGRLMARFPVSPRYAKMLILSKKCQCVPYIAAIVSAMTVPEIFRPTNGSEDDKSVKKLQWKGTKNISGGQSKSKELGDAMVLLQAVACFEESRNKEQFCIRYGIRHKAMIEVHKICRQLRIEMNKNDPDLNLPLDLKLEPPNEEQINNIWKIVTGCFVDQVARLYSEEEVKLNKNLKNAYMCLDIEDPVFIHPSSVLFSELPRYVVYREIFHTSKYYMKGVSEINPLFLYPCAPAMCRLFIPLPEPVPEYNLEKDQIHCYMSFTFGSWKMPPQNCEMRKGVLKCTWFTFFLLDGQVFKFFKHYKGHLVANPSNLLQAWAKSIPHFRYLLHAICSKQVDSKKSLQEVWDKEPNFLLKEYQEWLVPEKRMEVECKWPPKT